MPFLSEPEPQRGVAAEVADGIRRLVAPNAGLMTYHGTNTYLIETGSGPFVLDPGPDDPRHVGDILAAAGRPLAGILVTHSHRDHIGAVAALKAASGAPLFAFAGIARLEPDVPLAAGDRVAGLVAVHTPGHASDHIALRRDDGVLFSGDHVMSWNSSVIDPPDGDMAAYLASLETLLAADDRLYLPGHGPPLPGPHALVRALITHRRMREAAILAVLGDGPLGAAEITARIYAQVAPWLLQAAERNVLAHLLKLRREGRVAEAEGGAWRKA